MMQVSKGLSRTIILVEHIGRGGSHHKWSDVSCWFIRILRSRFGHVNFAPVC
jgi:hypothetical protein